MRNIFIILQILLFANCNETKNQSNIKENQESLSAIDTTVSQKDTIHKGEIDVDLYNSIAGQGVLVIAEQQIITDDKFIPTVHFKIKNTSKNKTVKGYVILIKGSPDYSLRKKFTQDVKPNEIISNSIKLNVQTEKYSDFHISIDKAVFDDGNVY